MDIKPINELHPNIMPPKQPGDYPNNSNNVGWICPKCHRALAPWVQQCPCNFNTVTTSPTGFEFPRDTFTPSNPPIWDGKTYIGDPPIDQLPKITC